MNADVLVPALLVELRQLLEWLDGASDAALDASGGRPARVLVGDGVRSGPGAAIVRVGLVGEVLLSVMLVPLTLGVLRVLMVPLPAVYDALPFCTLCAQRSIVPLLMEDDGPQVLLPLMGAAARGCLPRCPRHCSAAVASNMGLVGTTAGGTCDWPTTGGRAELVSEAREP